MELTDLIFWSRADNNTGLKNITGVELAALINAAATGANPNIGKGATIRNTAITTFNGLFGAFSFSTGVGGGGTVFYDDLGFFAGDSAPTRLTIPLTDPPITRVMCAATVRWQSGINIRRLLFAPSTGSGRGDQGVSDNSRDATGLGSFDWQLDSMVFDNTTGDFFELFNFQNSGGNIIVDDVQFQITVMG